MKKRIYFICGIVIAISAIIGIYNRLVLLPLRAQTFVISPWEVVDLYAAKPAFWLCLGIVLALLVRVEIGRRPRRVMLGLGIVVTIAYCALAAVSLAAASNGMQPFTLLLMWILQRAPVFLIPGAWIGAGLGEADA